MMLEHNKNLMQFGSLVGIGEGNVWYKYCSGKTLMLCFSCGLQSYKKFKLLQRRIFRINLSIISLISNISIGLL